MEHGCGDDEGRVGILQSRPLLELPVDALEVLTVLADGLFDCLLGPALVNGYACGSCCHVVFEQAVGMLFFLSYQPVYRSGDLQLLGYGL